MSRVHKALKTAVQFFAALALTATAQAVPKTQDHIREIRSLQDFNDISLEPGGFLKLGRTIKVLIDNRDKNNPVPYFVNANFCAPGDDCSEKRPMYATSHFHFAHRSTAVKGFVKLWKKKPGDEFSPLMKYYNNSFYTTNDVDRLFYAGRMQTYKNNKTGKNYILIRFIERDKIHDDMITKAYRIINEAVTVENYEVAFAANSEAQVYNGAKPADVIYFRMADLITSAPYIPMKQGQACGFLRKNVEDASNLQPLDIPVFHQLPIDLPYVSGTLSTVPQDVGSHVNLKADERGTPNAVVMTEEGLARLAGFQDGEHVELTVGQEDFAIRRSTSEEVAACRQRYEDKFKGEWLKARYEHTDVIKNFDQLCKDISATQCLDLASKYGGKVAGLGFLNRQDVVGMNSRMQKKLGYRLTPMGLALPLSMYKNFIEHNMALNPQLEQNLNELIQGERDPNQPSDRKRQLIVAIQDALMKGQIPAEDYERVFNQVMSLKSKVDAFYGTDLNKIKIRSSANVEDIEKFNGAGLHDSLSARISKSAGDAASANALECNFKSTEKKLKKKSKSLACAIKGVYASLWNYRAVQERTGRRFDHSTATMGLSIQPSYSFREEDGPTPFYITANSVLITRVAGTKNVYGYRVSSQVDNKLVTNPVENTQAELATMTFQATNFEPSLARTILQYAKPESTLPALDRAVMDIETMKNKTRIAAEVERAYCFAKKKLYAPKRKCETIISSQSKPLALDMEFKVYNAADERNMPGAQLLIKQVRQYWGR